MVVASRALPLAEFVVDELESAIISPPTEVIVNGLPLGKVMSNPKTTSLSIRPTFPNILLNRIAILELIMFGSGFL